MSTLAVSGSPPGPHPTSSVADFIFSNPFSNNSELMRNAPDGAKNHVLPIVPEDKPLFIDPLSNATLTWSQTRNDALRVAAALHSFGLHPSTAPSPSHRTKGRRIAPIVSPVVMLHLPNCLPFAPLLCGIFAAGVTSTLANPALSPRELAWLLQNAQPRVIVTMAATLEVVKHAIETVTADDVKRELRNVKIFVVDPTASDYSPSQSNGRVAASGTRDWKQLLHPQPLPTPVSFTTAECRARTAVILWSSGTTGRSKGVLLSHSALTTSIASLWHVFPDWGANERFLGFAPFYHVFGLVTLLLVAPACGATIFTMSKFDLKTMLEQVGKQRITFLHMAPPVAVHLSKNPLVDGADFGTVRAAMSGGAPLPPAIVDSVYKRLGFCIKMGYGLSETASTTNQVGETYAEIQAQHASVGPPLYGVELKVVAINDRKRVLERGEEGEIAVRSPGVMTCYFNNESATAEALDDDGWFYTGDVGKIDDRGYLWITDRLKEMIKVKGFQVAPAELEALLCASDLVADAAITSVYDEAAATELPRAYIVPRESQLFDQCAPSAQVGDLSSLQHLGTHVKELIEKTSIYYKWLRGNVVFVQQLPKSPAGKILRRELKDVRGREIILYPAKSPLERAKL